MSELDVRGTSTKTVRALLHERRKNHGVCASRHHGPQGFPHLPRVHVLRRPRKRPRRTAYATGPGRCVKTTPGRSSSARSTPASTSSIRRTCIPPRERRGRRAGAQGAGATGGYRARNQSPRRDELWTERPRYAGVGIIPWSPLARGRLARGSVSSDPTRRAETDQFGTILYGASADADVRVIERVDAVAKTRGVPNAQIALAVAPASTGGGDRAHRRCHEDATPR